MPPTTISDPAYYTAPMSYHEWKREASLGQILFGLQLPYRKPDSPIARFFWRRRLWVECTFALSMLEPWEKLLIIIFIYATLLLLWGGGLLYLPHYLSFVQARTAYYLFGYDAAGAADSLVRIKDALNVSLASVGSLGSSIVSLGRGAVPSEL